MLDDYRRLPRSIEPAARDWERWLKGAQPTLSVTFDQHTATENAKAVYLSILHPFVRQAARFLEIAEPKFCSLEAVSEDIPAGTHHFALYHWTKLGIKPDEMLVPVADDPTLEASLMAVLQTALDSRSQRLPNREECDELDIRQHAKWIDAHNRHLAQNRKLVEHRLQSLTVSHRARRKMIEDQIVRATNEKIRLMKESELERANADYERRLSELEQAANSGDVRAIPVVFGTLSVGEVAGNDNYR
jgi:hypothetical protein